MGTTTPKLRQEAGRHLRKLRESAGLTQQQIAKKVGLEYYTMVSQIELGKTRVPPERVHQWASALGVPPAELAQQLMRYYDPITWRLLFDGVR